MQDKHGKEIYLNGEKPEKEKKTQDISETEQKKNIWKENKVWKMKERKKNYKPKWKKKYIKKPKSDKKILFNGKKDEIEAGKEWR